MHHVWQKAEKDRYSCVSKRAHTAKVPEGLFGGIISSLNGLATEYSPLLPDPSRNSCSLHANPSNEIDDRWNWHVIEYQIVGSSPNIEEAPLILQPAVEHPWTKFHPVSGLSSSMSSSAFEASSTTSQPEPSCSATFTTPSSERAVAAFP